MAMESVLVTGANRGIGLEFVKQFVKLSDPPRFVFATCRNPALASVSSYIYNEYVVGGAAFRV